MSSIILLSSWCRWASMLFCLFLCTRAMGLNIGLADRVSSASAEELQWYDKFAGTCSLHGFGAFTFSLGVSVSLSLKGVITSLICQVTVRFKRERTVMHSTKLTAQHTVGLALQKQLFNGHYHGLSPTLGCAPSRGSGCCKPTQMPTSSGVSGSTSSVF